MEAATASVLTAEDNPIVRADLRLVLEDAGFTVVADAQNGVEAVELAREHQPDVIVLDLGLPHLDGVEATRQILAERDVPIVALTGRPRTLARDALGAGATSFVVKPFSGSEVVTAVHNALERNRDQDALDARSGSRLAISSVLDAIGYPPAWAGDLEQRAWESGHVWRSTPSSKRDR